MQKFEPKGWVLLFHPELIKERIFDKDKSISEEAYDLGFRYPQHFTSLFKQKVGVSPLKYRSANQGLCR